MAKGESCGVELLMNFNRRGLNRKAAELDGMAGMRFMFGPELLKRNGGAERDRTAGLLVANEALSQLSYSPTT